MTKKSSMALGVVGIVASAAILAGCGSAGASAETGSSNATITFIGRNGPGTQHVAQLAKLYHKDTGRTVNIRVVGRAAYFTTLSTMMTSHSSSWDVASLLGPNVPEYAASGALQPLGTYMNSTSGYQPNKLLVTYKYQGKVYAIPRSADTVYLFYRSDLIKTPPTTWNQYLADARKWTKSLNPSSPTTYGASMMLEPPGQSFATFMSVLWSYGGYVNHNGKVGLNNAGAIKAADFVKTLYTDKLEDPSVTSWGYTHTLDALESGEVAMAGPFWDAGYPQLLSSNSPYKSKIKVAVLPGVRQADGSIQSTPIMTNWTFGINKYSKHKKAAWEFLSWLTGPQGAKAYAKLGGTPVRSTTLSNPAIQKSNPNIAPCWQP